MVVLVANVGERDLYYNVDSEEAPNFCHFEWRKPDAQKIVNHLGCQPGARHIAQAILKRMEKNLEGELQRCRYPILGAVLESIVQEEPIDHLVLVVTDQPPSTSPEHRDRDSVHTGEILKRLIDRDYEDRVREIEVIPYRLRPAREESYAFFGELLPQVAPVKDSDLHASLSGGIPALNDSLQEQALRLYRDKCHLYEVEPPSEEECRRGIEKGVLKPVSAKPFLKDLAISLIEQLINRYDYSGALEVLKVFRAVKFWADEVEVVLEYAERRAHLDFDGAKKKLSRYQNQSPLRQWFRAVNNRDAVTPLAEIWYVAQTRVETEDYADLIWRIFALSEYLKERLLPKKIDPKSPWAVICSINERLYPCLKSLRNAVIHDLKGISYEMIEANFRPHQEIKQLYNSNLRPMELLLLTLEYLVTQAIQLERGGQAQLSNPYREINSWLKRQFQQDKRYGR
jgi:hypothetical protein